MQDLDNNDKIHQADKKSLLKLINELINDKQKNVETVKDLSTNNDFINAIFKIKESTSDEKIEEHNDRANKLSDNSLFDNIIAWVQKNVESIKNLFTNKDNNLTAIFKIKESASDEKIEKHSDRNKRDLETSASKLLWANSHKGGISKHLLKLNDGSKVLKSEKASVAEALNGRAAICKILAQAKAKAAKAAQQKNLYDNDDFSKWLLSGSSFDTDIFKHPFHQSSDNARITDNNKNNHVKTENADNQHIFLVSHHVSKPINHNNHNEIKYKLPDSTAIGIDTDRSYTKLLHKSEHQEHLSPEYLSELQSTSGEEHGYDTNEMLHKLAVSRHTHGLSSYEDEEDTGLRHTSSHEHAPHMHFRITKDQETGNNIPKWKYAKWMHMDSSEADASRAFHSAEPYEFETSNEREEYGRKFIFKTLFEPGEDDGKIYIGHRNGQKFSEKINIHEDEGDETNYDRLADSSSQHDSLIDPHQENNIRNRNKQNLDGIQHSIIHSATSMETKEGIENKQSGNILITKTSTGKPVNIDIEHYHSRDQNVAANSAKSFSSSLSNDKDSERTNNILASSSVDGSATVETKTENDYSLLGRTHSVIDNDVTSTGIEMDFSGIKSHSPVSSSLAHSSLSHAHSKTHLENQKVHHSINGYEGSTANVVASETKHLMDPKTMKSQNKDHDSKTNQEIIVNVASSTETTPSIMDEHHHRAVSSNEQISDEEVSHEENYIKPRRKYMDLKKKYIDHARSMKVINVDDNSAEVLLPELPLYKHGKDHVLHDVNDYDYDDYDVNDYEMSDHKKIVSAKDLKKIQIDYDNSEDKEDKFTNNIKVSKESQMITSNEHLSHDRYSQHEKNDKHNQLNYRSHHNKQNRHKNNNEYNHHNIYNQHHSQNNHHILDEKDNSIKLSTASDATEFDTWNKYIYFIEDQERRNNESNASFESSASIIRKGKKQNNAKHEKILLKTRGRKYMSDEDKHLKKHTNLSDPVLHSIEINKITSTNNNEEKMKSEDNTKNRSKIITREENLISDDSTIDITSHTKHSNKKISNNNDYYSQASSKSIKNPRSDIQTETKHIYDPYGGNANVDINTKQIANAAQFIESKSNLRSASSKTSESDNIKKIMAIEQASDEKISSNGIINDYQYYDNNISDFSKLNAKSQMNTNHSNKKLKSTHQINANVKTLTKASLSDTIDKSQSNTQNAIASAKSSAKSQIESWDYWNNKKYNANAKASANTISVDLKNKRKSELGNTSIFSKLPVQSEEESETYLNDLENIAISTAKSEALSGAANKSSIELKMKMERKSNHFNNVRKDANVKMSSTAKSDNVKNEWLFSPSRMFQSKIHLTDNKDNKINSTSKASAESILSNIIDDNNRSHLEKSFSSSSVLSSEKSQAKHEHDNLQKNETNVNIAEISTLSTAFNNSDNGHRYNLSKSSLPSKWSKERHIKNKHYSDNIKVNHNDNIGVKTEIEDISGIVRSSHQQESINSLSSSSSSTKPQILNKNTKTIITSNDVSDIDEHNLLHASSSSQTASKNNLNVQKNDPQTANTATLTISALTNNDKDRREDNILKTKWLTDLKNKNNLEKFANDKSIERDEIIKSKLETALNAMASEKTVTSTDIENVMKASSSSNSKAKSWTHNEHDSNQLREGKIIINNLEASKISHNIKNNHKNKLLASSLSDSHSRSEEFEDIANKTTMETISNSANNIYHNNLLKDTSIISNKKIQTSKIKNENEINADNSDTESEINSRRMKYLKGINNVNKLSTDLSTLNSFNSENQNDILKVTSDNLYTEMSQKDQHKSDFLSNINRIANTNTQDKYWHGLISSTDTTIQSMIDHESDILKKKETVNSETRNNIKKWNTKLQTTTSSSSNAESQNRKKIVVKPIISAESTANNINKNAHNLMQEKSAFDPTHIAEIDKQHSYGNQEADVTNTGRTRAEISNSQRFMEHFKNDAKEKAQSQQNNLKHHKIITSNIKLSEGTNSSKIENAHQKLLKDVTASNSHTKVQHKYISDIVKESWNVTGNAATSAQTKSSEKVENKSQEKLLRDSVKFNSYTKSQIENKNDSSASEEQIIASIETLTNSAISNNFKNVQQNKLNKNLLSDLKLRDTSNGDNSDHQQKSIQTTFSSDTKEHAENENTVNNIGKNLKAVTNTMASAISSNNIETTNTQDSSQILSSSNLYTASQIDNAHSRNIAQDGQERIFTVTQASPISLVTSANNQDKQKEILHIQDPKNQSLTKTRHNDNNFSQKVYDGEDATVSRQATSFNNDRNKHQNNLLKATSLINSFADTQSMQNDESSIRRKQQLTTTDSIASSNSNISGCIDNTNKNLEKITGISSSNSYAKSNAQYKNHVDITEKKHIDIFNTNKSAIISSKFKDTNQNKSLRITSSSNLYTDTEKKNDNTNSKKKALDAALNAKVKTISFNDIKNIDPQDVIKKSLSETSSDLIFKAQTEIADDSKILKNDYEKSAKGNTIIKTKNNNYHNQQEDLHKTRFLSSDAQDSQHNIKSISSGNSYVSATNENIVKSGKSKKDGETFNLSTLEKMKIHNNIKKELNNWPITMSDAAALVEERIENKDKFDNSKTTEKVTVQNSTETVAKTAAANNIENEQYDIHVGHRSKLEDSWNAETKIQNAILDASIEKTALKRTKNKSERKSISDNKLETLSSNEAHAKTQIINKEKYNVTDTSESSVSTEGTQRLITSAKSSASTSNNMNIDLGTKYDQINNKMSISSLITSVSEDTKEREKHPSSVQTSLHSSDKINECNKDVETRKFIHQATNLYRILGKEQDSEILLMKKNSKGPVQIAGFKKSISPLIAYRLIPREVYERIRTILANKQISCTNCPPSNR
ncbi:serine-rich adhesin for platelets [Polyergus mexicanus]|uniref:serine-rich adhesin for platelets n=1 Tax=Polyergus mexicanus TaxID=615972 RepID=UPI0038B679B1